MLINQICREEIAVLRLFQFESIRKWTSGNQSRTSTFWKAGRVPFLEIFGLCHTIHKAQVSNSRAVMDLLFIHVLTFTNFEFHFMILFQIWKVKKAFKVTVTCRGLIPNIQVGFSVQPHQHCAY